MHFYCAKMSFAIGRISVPFWRKRHISFSDFSSYIILLYKICVCVCIYIKPMNYGKCLCKFALFSWFEYRLLSVQMQKLFIGGDIALANLPLGMISLFMWYIRHQVVSGAVLWSDFDQRCNLGFPSTLLTFCVMQWQYHLNVPFTFYKSKIKLNLFSIQGDLSTKKIFLLGSTALMNVFWMLIMKRKNYMKILLVILEKGANRNVRNPVANFLSSVNIKIVLW